MSRQDQLAESVAAWVFNIALGPFHFAGEMVGPTGGTYWRQWVGAILGTLLWGLGLMYIWGLVS